jgi:ferrous iron transport protein B
MLFVFQAIFSWANLPMNLIDRLFNVLGVSARTHLPAGLLTDLIVSGILRVSAVSLCSYADHPSLSIITLLEDSGYMPRAAFHDGSVNAGGWSARKAFVPLLSSFACAVPGSWQRGPSKIQRIAWRPS